MPHASARRPQRRLIAAAVTLGALALVAVPRPDAGVAGGPLPPLVLDSFTRAATADGWGTADAGGAWDQGLLRSASWWTTAGRGHLRLAAADALAAPRTPALTERDTDSTVVVSTDADSTRGPQLVAVSARGSSAGDYRARLRFEQGVVNLSLRRGAADGSDVAISREIPVRLLNHAANRRFALRMVVTGANPTQIKAKVWLHGTREPYIWQIIQRDSTSALQGPGRAGVVAATQGTANAPIVVSVDDFTVRADDLPPVPQIRYSCTARECTLDASGSTDDRGITGYAWDFGDGGTASASTPSANHTYAAVGSYKVTLRVTDTAGQVGTAAVQDVLGGPQPDIVVIMTDDQTLRDLAVMPKTRRLIGDAGATFDNAFISFPLCCPARATFLTGQYSHNHGVFTNSPPKGGYAALDHSNTLPLWLHAVGYRTTLIGKYLNSYGDVNPTEVMPGWDDFQALTAGTVFKYFDFRVNDNGRIVTYGTTAADYQTDVLANRAVATIAARAGDPNPFFLWLTPIAPHNVPPKPAPRHVHAFDAAPLPTPPSFNEADVSDKPRFVRSAPLLDAAAVGRITEVYRSRLESLLAVDDLVERVVNALDAAGRLDNTYLVFTSDNGWFSGEHRIEKGKVRLYEESTRTPLLVRGPGVPVGVRVANVTANPDLTATIVERAHATPGRVLDGMSLDRVTDPVLGNDRAVLFENNDPSLATRLNSDALRTERYEYVEWNYPDGTTERELYDLFADPYQLTNLANQPAYLALRNDLAARLAAVRNCSGAACITTYP